MVKTCSKCKAVKPLSDYHKNSKSRDGHHCVCKLCNIEKRRAWYALNKKDALDNKKEYYKNHKDSIKNKSSKRYQKNKVIILNKQKLYYDNNKVNIIQYNKRYRKINKTKIKIQDAERKKKNYSKNRDVILKKSLEYHRNNRDKAAARSRKWALRQSQNISDKYVIANLKHNGFTKEDINSNPFVIEAKREIIKIIRHVKEKTGKKHSRS